MWPILSLNTLTFGNLEAAPGIEPGYTDLQSAASPLRHAAIRKCEGAGYSKAKRYAQSLTSGFADLEVNVTVSRLF